MLRPSFPRVASVLAVGVLVAVAGAVVGGSAGWLWASSREPAYASTATLMVTIPSADAQTELDAVRGKQVLAPTFAAIAVTPATVGQVAGQLGLGSETDAILRSANARAEPGGVTIAITARYRTPSVAAAIANGLATRLIEQTSPAGGAGGTLTVMLPATPATAPESPAIPLDTALGGIAGAQLAIAIWLYRRRPRDGPSRAREPRLDFDEMPGIRLGLSLGAALFASIAIDVPGSVTLGLAVMSVAASAAFPGAGFTIVAILLPQQEPAVLGALGLKLPIIAAIAYGLLARLIAARRLPSIDTGRAMLFGCLGLAFVSAIPLLNGFEGDRAVASAARFLQFGDGLALILLAAHYFSTHDARPYLATLVVSASIAASLAILQVASVAGVWPFVHGLYAAPDALNAARVTGPFQNPNYFGLFLGMAIVLATGLAWVEPRYRRLMAPLLVVLLVALASTLSRGSLTAAALGLLTLVWFRNRRLAAAMGVLLAFGILVAYPFLVDTRLDRSATGGLAAGQAGLSESDQQRFESVLAGLSMVGIDPAFGVGFGQYEYVSARFVGSSPATSAHNQYLKILAEQGLVGAAVLGAAAIALGIRVRRSVSSMRRSVIAMLVVYLVGGFVLEPLTTLQTSGILAIVLGAILAEAPGPEVLPDRLPVERPAVARLVPQEST